MNDMTEYERGRQDGKKDALDKLRMMLELMTKDKDRDIAQCAEMLLQGLNS